MEDTMKHQKRNNNYPKIIKWIFIGIFTAIGFALVLGLIVMFLWNWLMPGIFGFTVITYWQAVGLLLLMKLFFGGLSQNKPNNHNNRYSGHFKEKFSKENMSKWKHYDHFWKEKGEKLYNEYIMQIKKDA